MQRIADEAIAGLSESSQNILDNKSLHLALRRATSALDLPEQHKSIISLAANINGLPENSRTNAISKLLEMIGLLPSNAIKAQALENLAISVDNLPPESVPFFNKAVINKIRMLPVNLQDEALTYATRTTSFIVDPEKNNLELIFNTISASPSSYRRCLTRFVRYEARESNTRFSVHLMNVILSLPDHLGADVLEEWVRATLCSTPDAAGVDERIGIVCENMHKISPEMRNRLIRRIESDNENYPSISKNKAKELHEYLIKATVDDFMSV
ncbi:hypothetical protein AWB78_07919 [Caballeronia calidae]|uniref:Uncharacterized protein n=1 Tax=Caballeronia calidae TaxID=1777139 RepID=A0A158EH63_9BURK|nr:hypothetical protein [Caballeronia calidae]SAL06178.1 hypothetical protein AWB78_07919 [Caballeronia calidae]